MAQSRSYPKIVQDITGCVQDLKRDYNDTKRPITDDSLLLHKFCAKLEYLLQIDMKGRTSVLGGRRDYWEYFYKCLNKVKGLNDGLRFVRAMTEVKSSLGRGRAFIRYSLVHHRLGDSLQQCLSNTKITGDWYSQTAVLLNTVHCATVINAFYDLNDIQFDLAPTGYDLDTAWPTFARKAVGASGLYLWMPPSRTTSTSSINSQQSASDSYPNSPMIESRPSIMDDQLTQLQKEFEECEQVNRQLRQRIDQLENDNEEIHQMAQETEECMAAVRLNSEKETFELQEQVERLEEGLSSKEKELFCLEAKWKDKVLEAEKTASDLYTRIEVLNKQHESRDKMLIESEKDLREKLQVAEGSLNGLKQLLNTYQVDLASRTVSETSAKEKVSELECKLADAEHRHLELITRMDGIVQNKDKTVSSHFESASKVHELLTRLEGAETEKLQLQGIKEELIRKLELSKMQRTAENESKDENVSEKLSLIEIEALSSRESSNLEEYLQQIEELQKMKQKLESRNKELSKKVQKFEAALQKSASEKTACEKQSDELKRTVSNLEESEWLLREEKDELQRNVPFIEKERDEAVGKASLLVGLENRLRESEKHVEGLKHQNLKLLDLQSTFQRLMQDLETSGEVSGLVEPSTVPKVHSEAYQNSASCTDGSKELVDDESLQTKIKNILAQKASGVSNLQAALREVADLKAQDADLLKQLRKTKETQELNSSEVSYLRETITHLQGKLADAGLRSESQNQILTRKEAELGSLATQMNMLQQRVSDLKESVVQKSLELETHQQNSNRANNQLKSLKAALEKMTSEKESLTTQLVSVKADFETHKHDHEQLQNEKKELERRNKELQEDTDRQKQISKDLENTLEDTRRLIDNNVSLEQVFEDRKQKMIKEHEDKVEFLTHQFNMIQEEMDKANADKSKFEEEHKTMSTEFKEIKEKLELMATERNEIKKTNDTLNAEIAQVNETSQLAQTKKEEITQKMEQLRSEMFEALEENTTRMLRLENKLHDAQEERDKGKVQVSELETELTDTKKKLDQADHKCDERTQQLSSLECVMQQEVSALKFQLSSEAMEYQQAIQGYKHQELNLQGLQDRFSEQEEIVDSLQSDLNLARAQLEQQQKQAKDAQEAASAKEGERSVLQEAIQQMSKAMEELQVGNLNSEEELATLRAASQGKKTSLESKLIEVENDNVELKKQLIKLIRDKDTLWQWTDKLDYQRKVKASERWIDDSEVTHCMQCRVEFSLMVRRHHCRLCGRIFCTKCSNCYVLTSHSRKKSRVCEQCFVIHQHASETDKVVGATMLTLDSDEEIDDEMLAKSRSFISSSSQLSDELRSTPTTEAASSQEDISPASQEDTPPAEASPEAVRVARQEGGSVSVGKSAEGAAEKPKEDKQVTSRRKAETTQVVGSESSYYYSCSEQPENPVIVLDSPLPSRHPVQSNSDKDEPDFDLISEEEIRAARDEWSALDSPGGLRSRRVAEKSTFTSPILHMTELEAGNGANDEITIKAGHSHAVPIHLDAPGIILCWEFASAPKTVAFSVTYQPADSPPSDATPGQQAPLDELIPLCKCNSHRHAVQGELMARKAGIYTLLFDNSFSRFTQKSVKYSLQVKRPEAAY